MSAPANTSREETVLKKVVEILKNDLNAQKIILFGSRAKGTADKNADFDLAVHAPKPAIEMERELHGKIENAAGLYKIDLVYLDHVQADFRELILKTGKVIYER